MKKIFLSALLTVLVAALLLSVGAAAYADDTEPIPEEEKTETEVIYYSQKYVDTIANVNTADTAPGYAELFGNEKAEEPAPAGDDQPVTAPEAAETVSASESAPSAAETQKAVPAVSSEASERSQQKNVSMATITVLIIVAGLVGASVVLLVDKK